MPAPPKVAVLFTKQLSLIVMLLKCVDIAPELDIVIFTKQLSSRVTLLEYAIIPPPGASMNVVLVNLTDSALCKLRAPHPIKSRADISKCVMFEQLTTTGPEHTMRLLIRGNDVASPSSIILD